MNKFLILLLVVFASCKKEAAKEVAPPVIDASIKSVTFYPTYAGSHQTIGFTVELIADSNNITKVILYKTPKSLRWEVDKPQTGRYIMHDNLSEFPTYSESAFYYFSFVKKDGTVINEKEFQVY